MGSEEKAEKSTNKKENERRTFFCLSIKLTAKLTAIMALRVCREFLSGSIPVRCYDVFHVMK